MSLELMHHRERETIGTEFYGETLGFRKSTPVPRYPVNFAMNEGGMGDFVNYATATRWIAKNCPWIEAVLLVPRYLLPLMQDMHAEFKHWKVRPSETPEESLIEGASMIGPGLHVNGRIINPQLLTVLGAHPMDVGFAYFAGMTPPPEGEVLPVLDYPRQRLLPKIKQIKGPYAVFTTGATTQSRTVKGRHLNPVLEYTKSLGITPVFIGKERFVESNKNTVSYADDINFDIGVDMRNQTSVKDAACIMQHAAFTAGLDNGNLHVAALMQDSKIIFGYNITSIEHRVPRRNHGITVNLQVPDSILPCSGCQSKWRQLHTHTFDKCYYGDVVCVDMLFWENAKLWKKSIDQILT